MNKNDPERARCSAPEEEYDTQQTPESAADARTRKHLRVWVRRLQCNEAYEASLPTLTRGKKRATASSSKDPYEWVRCCNPSCGKWRAVLRCQDAKSSVIDRTKDGEWYCVMNTWDEKTASCAAPQENLPAVGTKLHMQDHRWPVLIYLYAVLTCQFSSFSLQDALRGSCKMTSRFKNYKSSSVIIILCL